MTLRKRFDLRKVDFIKFADRLSRRSHGNWQAVMLPMCRKPVFMCIGHFNWRAGVPLVLRLGTTGPRTFSRALLVSRWRL